ncbi:MAG: DUF935 family protein [Tannerellaceae bacterium]|jgi:hypothetical protein|nr:DUF935 family protein [Tannerellaceae bacterium]
METKTTKKRATAQKKEAAPIVQTLVIRQPERKTSDVARWRNALVSADGGRISQLYDLYEDLLIDGILYDAHQKRIEAVTNAELIFQDARGKDVPAVRALMESLDWEVLLQEIAQPVFWGRAGVEFDFSAGGFSVTPIPRKHISLEKGLILIEANGERGIPYATNDQLLVLGRRREWGIFLKTAPYAIWKRGGFGDWAQWLEIFGMPQRVGKYNMYDPQSRILLEEALKNAGASPWCVIPEGSSIETVKGSESRSSTASYNEFRMACNEEMLITVLGQTLTTIAGDKGARSLGEVHKKVEEGKNKADMRYVEKVLNTHLMPLLEKRGFPVTGGKFLFPAATGNLSVADIVSLSGILEIPKSYLYDKYGIPVPQDGEPVAASTAATPPVEEGKGKDPKAPEKKEETKKETKKEQKKTLRDFFALAPTLWSGATHFIARLSDNTKTEYDIDINGIMRRAVREIYGDRGEELLNSNLFDITNNALQKAVDVSLSETAKTSPDFVRQFKENTAVFAAFKNHQQTRQIAALLYDEEGKLKPFYKFKREALELSKDYNIRWLQTEYNTAVRTARMAANMKKYEKTAHLYPNLEYIETTAAHPRVKHLTYVGTILPIDHSWWDDHLPPAGWSCACSVKPTDKPPTPVPDGEYTDPVFRNNPARTAEFVNIKETAYYKQTEEKLKEEVTEAAKRLQRASETPVTEVYEGNSGGYLKIVEQNKHEREDNLATYKTLADTGGRYALLGERKNEKNPDALNLETLRYSEAKHPDTPNGQRAVQRSIREASKQGAEEVIIRLKKEYPSNELHAGVRAALQPGKCENIETIILIRKEGEPLVFDAKKLRKRFAK